MSRERWESEKETRLTNVWIDLLRAEKRLDSAIKSADGDGYVDADEYADAIDECEMLKAELQRIESETYEDALAGYRWDMAKAHRKGEFL